MKPTELLSQRLIVPVIALDRAEDAVPLAEALSQGGLAVAEVTFRTAAAPAAIRAIRDRFPDFLVGAGKVTTLEELRAAIDSGAHFAVAARLNPRLVAAARDAGLPFYPGVCTPTEIETAMEEGATTLKFFPAETVGGVRALKAIAAPYAHRGLRFIPTGGIGSAQLPSHLAERIVLAVGGSWMVASPLLKEKAWAKVTALTSEAVDAADAARVPAV